MAIFNMDITACHGAGVGRRSLARRRGRSRVRADARGKAMPGVLAWRERRAHNERAENYTMDASGIIAGNEVR